jgi:hypothetical protein
VYVHALSPSGHFHIFVASFSCVRRPKQLVSFHRVPVPQSLRAASLSSQQIHKLPSQLRTSSSAPLQEIPSSTVCNTRGSFVTSSRSLKQRAPSHYRTRHPTSHPISYLSDHSLSCCCIVILSLRIRHTMDYAFKVAQRLGAPPMFSKPIMDMLADRPPIPAKAAFPEGEI